MHGLQTLDFLNKKAADDAEANRIIAATKHKADPFDAAADVALAAKFAEKEGNGTQG
jgi:hypothetical protein